MQHICFLEYQLQAKVDGGRPVSRKEDLSRGGQCLGRSMNAKAGDIKEEWNGEGERTRQYNACWGGGCPEAGD